MNKQDVILKTQKVIEEQLSQRGYATCVDSLVKMGWLMPADVMLWKNGKVTYLERVCKVNLSKLSLFMHTYFAYAKEKKYTLRYTYYKANKIKKPLCFSKYAKETIEKQYATHIVCLNKKITNNKSVE